MTAADRQKLILDMIRTEGFATIEDLAEHFAVTPQTIRRDVNILCSQALLRRHHGGVGLLELAGNLDFDRRRVLNLAAKQQIARAVARLVPPRASLFLGIGTTPEQVAIHLREHEALTVVTCNLGVAAALCENPEHTVVLAGGKLRNQHRDTLGDDVLRLLDAYKVDIAVFGIGGLEEDGSLLDFDRDEVRAREAMAANSRRRILIADHSKFGRLAPARGGHLEEVDVFVTDRPVGPRLARRLEANDVRIVIGDDLFRATERTFEAEGAKP